MKIVYSSLTKEQLYNIKEYISLDNKKNAIIFLSKIKNKIEILATYPYLGKINTTFNLDNMRDFVIFGYKIIYKCNKESILILSIYKYIDFDENSLI